MYSSFGSVFNIGNHWVCMFFNRTSQEIEYFNSFGTSDDFGSLPANVQIILTAVKNSLSSWSKMPWTIVHEDCPALQKDARECGMFALYYIHQRLLRKTRAQILAATTVNDASMARLRAHYFIGVHPPATDPQRAS